MQPAHNYTCWLNYVPLKSSGRSGDGYTWRVSDPFLEVDFNVGQLLSGFYSEDIITFLSS